MKTLSYSGASLKGAFLLGVCSELINNNILPDKISGVSYGSYIAPFHALGYLPPAFIEEALTLTEKKAFKRSPTKVLNILSALVTGRPSIGKQSIEPFKKHYTKHLHNYLPENKCFIAVHHKRTRTVQHIDIAKKDYKTAIKYIHASASIPPFTDWVKIEGEYYCDPGISNHITSHWMCDKGTEHISVFSRPSFYDLEDYESTNEPPKNIIDNLGYIVNNLVLWTSIKDEQLTNKKCALMKIKHHKIHAPYKLMDEFYKFDEDLNRAFFELGKQQVNKWKEKLN